MTSKTDQKKATRRFWEVVPENMATVLENLISEFDFAALIVLISIFTNFKADQNMDKYFHRDIALQPLHKEVVLT